ncbi:SDR family NAD(P)-dependent oxidoreductase [Bacillus shivajii]|uniref:SDR family oxidoreductase n=1 Tax=Bacillus shivajii TaxID=1983719 RepID=UPI001CF9C51A|nr:SDR family NAD(P)-dependent oxidoreductase [Bacillus shivajii]UCZ55176.1 SDR family NAD(P)-dependent oxidoreductase [Bacillus shivajii]
MLQDKVVVITGGSRGIGKEISRECLKEGMKVIVLSKTEESRTDVMNELSSYEGLSTYICDVSSHECVTKTFDKIYKTFKHIDILINNAGVGIWKNVDDMSPEEWNTQIGTNLTGVFYCSQYVFKNMKDTGGHIINIASDLGYSTIERGGAYCASKWGLIGLSGTMQKEGKPYGIRVSTVSPGLVQTDFGSVSAEKKTHGLTTETVASHVLSVMKTGTDAGEINMIVKP